MEREGLCTLWNIQLSCEQKTNRKVTYVWQAFSKFLTIWIKIVYLQFAQKGLILFFSAFKSYYGNIFE